MTEIRAGCAGCGIKGTRKPTGAVCCNYITVKIMPPSDETDWDEIRWWVAHDGVRVYANTLPNRTTEWYLQVDVRCGFLRRGNVCEVYPARPEPCQSYSEHDCEGMNGREEPDIELKTMRDVERYADAALRLGELAGRIKTPGKSPEPARKARYTLDDEE